jgi:hypothetical protein
VAADAVNRAIALLGASKTLLELKKMIGDS